ncbi:MULTISPECIES: arsenate reductase (glutaredoxin) [Shewanella]|uniref:Arsenate reductase n=1 Tax=Shewanella salipaludis TaxID=2723052 RepID=A0A972FWS7_9GAMM|nr:MULTISPECIES: arsenate reductase (glutaredoxin) [Shewanella]MCE9684652.1 arsenate reductase (glutaredoxin) [Shewanella sp. AS16]NMH67062.1 arsenate reductase (glutaredoxin) [Shewanella salipaludis]
MTHATIYHNPRCSKSRQTLALLEQQGCQLSVIEYLKTPPTATELTEILAALQLSPRELMRTKEDEYRALALDNPALSDAELIAAMQANPKLIERPIVLVNGKAALGRPPENVLTLL